MLYAIFNSLEHNRITFNNPKKKQQPQQQKQFKKLN